MINICLIWSIAHDPAYGSSIIGPGGGCPPQCRCYSVHRNVITYNTIFIIASSASLLLLALSSSPGDGAFFCPAFWGLFSDFSTPGWNIFAIAVSASDSLLSASVSQTNPSVSSSNYFSSFSCFFLFFPSWCPYTFLQSTGNYKLLFR